MTSHRIFKQTRVIEACTVLSFVLAAVSAHPASAQSDPVVVYSFTGGADGSDPTTSLTQESTGDFIIGAESGGANSAGAIDQLNAKFKEHTLLALTNSDGGGPTPSALVLGPQGDYYGTTFTPDNGSASTGILFKVNPSGSIFKVLHTFSGGNAGADPDGGVTVVGTELYGTASAGGLYGQGFVYKISYNGANFKVLHQFKKHGDGRTPYEAPVLGTNGLLYGATFGTGNGVVRGTIYSVATDGTSYSTVYTFTGGADGDSPGAGRLIMDSDGNLYGASYGVDSNGLVDYGAIFEFTPGTGIDVLHTFDGADGQQPWCNLLLDNGVIYGATSAGGSAGIGTLYSINAGGSDFDAFYSFGTAAGDPAQPNAGNLVLAKNGSIYGVTRFGGANGGSPGDGAVYSFSPEETD
jgi:uncharacterized repeat protein (TIGR03803 family)